MDYDHLDLPTLGLPKYELDRRLKAIIQRESDKKNGKFNNNPVPSKKDEVKKYYFGIKRQCIEIIVDWKTVYPGADAVLRIVNDIRFACYRNGHCEILRVIV